MKFFTIVIISILCGAEVDLFTPGLPEIREYFSLSHFMLQLLLSVNFIAYCIFCLFAGALGDHFNRRTIILLGLWIFALGSFFCVFAPNFTVLLIGRFLQGMGVACPFALLFAEIMDSYPREKQAGLLAVINGITTIAMAFAPVVGSYVNLFFDWRGNFSLLLILSLLCLVLGHITLPQRKGDPSISLSPLAYLPLLKSPPVLTLTSAISFLVVPYWLFIAMSPILYMESFGVPLQHFGFYQGLIAIVFSILSFLSPRILAVLGQRRCLLYGFILCLISWILILLMTLLNAKQPLLITLIMAFTSIAVLFPITILFPLVVEIIPNAKGRSTALVLSVRLMLTAVVLQTVSYFYQGTIFPIGLAMVLCYLLFFSAVVLLYKNNWINLAKETGF